MKNSSLTLTSALCLLLPLTVNAEEPDKTNQTVGQENITAVNSPKAIGVVPIKVLRFLTYSYDRAGNRIERVEPRIHQNNNFENFDDFKNNEDSMSVNDNSSNNEDCNNNDNTTEN